MENHAGETMGTNIPSNAYFYSVPPSIKNPLFLHESECLLLTSRTDSAETCFALKHLLSKLLRNKWLVGGGLSDLCPTAGYLQDHPHISVSSLPSDAGK